MPARLRCALVCLTLVLGSALCAYAQLRPEVTVKPKPRKPPAAKVTPKPAEKAVAKPEQPEKPPEKVPEPEPAQIVIETSPNAEVYFDDQFVGRASPQGRLVIGNPNAGDHRLRVSLTGKRDYEATVTVVAGQTLEVAAALTDLPGRVLVRSLAGAEVFLDDSRRGTTDAGGQLVIAEVAMGSHELRITAPGKREHRENVAVEAGQEATIAAALEDLAPTAGAVIENPKDGLKYVWIPPGSFMMGCSPGDSECDADEKSAHHVTITEGFRLGQTEVTVAAYRRFASATGRAMPHAPNFNPGWSNERMPIVNVSWDDAQAFCAWVGGRLPTEAEWEYAARSGSTAARYGPLDEIAWYSSNSGGRAHEAAQKRANAWSLYDVLGNVWEWVNDWYDAGYYQNSPSQDPSGASSGQYRVLRGGSWLNGPRGARVSYRVRSGPDDGYIGVGFRCSREVIP